MREYWSYCGEIESLDILTFPDTGRFRGIAFITFVDEEGYAAALTCNGEDCDGQRLTVKKCKPSSKDRARQQAQQGAGVPLPQAAAPRAAAPAMGSPQAGDHQQGGAWRESPNKAGPSKTPGYHVAYVGNVAWEAGDKDIAKLFEPYNVTLVRLHTDKDTGKPKGYAHVHFRWVGMVWQGG